MDKPSGLARNLFENIWRFLEIRSGRACHGAYTRGCSGNRSRIGEALAPAIHRTAGWQTTFLLTSCPRSTQSVRIHARLLGGQPRRSTARTLIRRTYSRWLYAQTIDACHHGPGANESREIYQLRREIEYDPIRIHQRWYSNILCCLSCATRAFRFSSKWNCTNCQKSITATEF